MSASDCYDNVIGLSRTECNCVAPVAEASVSKSNLFMDELDGMDLDMAKAVADCNSGNLWEVLAKGREEGVKAFKTDLMAAIGALAKLKRASWSGALGDLKYTESVTPGTTYAGVTTFCANIRSGRMKIKSIGCSFNTTQSFNLLIHDNFGLLHTIPVESYANGVKWTPPPTEIILPMSLIGMANLQYWFTYEVGTLVANGVKSACGCNGPFIPVWQPSSNKFMWDGADARYRWAEFVQLAGTKGNDYLQRESTWTTTVELNGIILEVEFSCKVEETICKDSFDFEGNPLAAAMAAAIRYRANAWVLNKILTSKNVNRYTLMSEEKIAGTRNSFMKQYTQRINNYLAIEIVENHLNALSDCYECKETYGFQKVGIFS